MAQTVRLHEGFHEVDLIDARGQEEACEPGQRLFAQVASSVEVVAPRRIAGHELALVGVLVAGETSGDRPDAACIQALQQHRVGHQPRNAAVAVQERVNPEKAMVGGGGGQNAVRPAQPGVGRLEALQEAHQRARTDRHVTAHLDIALAERAGDHGGALAGCRAFGPEQVLWKRFAEAPMSLDQAVAARGSAAQSAPVDPRLNGDVGPGLELKIALAGIGAVIVPQRALDIDRVRVVAFDQVAVVAVHGPHEIGQRGEHALRQAAAKARRLAGQLHREVGQPGAVWRAFAHHQRLHQGHRFAAVCHCCVRFHVC